MHSGTNDQLFITTNLSSAAYHGVPEYLGKVTLESASVESSCCVGNGLIVHLPIVYPFHPQIQESPLQLQGQLTEALCTASRFPDFDGRPFTFLNELAY